MLSVIGVAILYYSGKFGSRGADVSFIFIGVIASMALYYGVVSVLISYS